MKPDWFKIGSIILTAMTVIIFLFVIFLAILGIELP